VNQSFERPNWDEYFMLQAELAKLRSNCMTRHVGAVIVRKNRQLATGYNGTPPGIKNCFEGGCKRCQLRMEGKLESGASLDRCLCNHAEANAIMHCAILGIEAGVEGAILYTTFVPCLECTKIHKLAPDSSFPSISNWHLLQPPSKQFFIPGGVPLYPVASCLFFRTITAPTCLVIQLDLSFASSA